MDGRLHPVANSTSTGCVDFRTSLSKFDSLISMVGFILIALVNLSSRLRGLRKVMAASSPHLASERSPVVAPTALRSSYRLRSHCWVQPIPDVARANLREAAAEVRCKNESR